MFALENFANTFCQHLVKVINLKLPTEINKEILMPKYNQIVIDRYSYTVF